MYVLYIHEIVCRIHSRYHVAACSVLLKKLCYFALCNNYAICNTLQTALNCKAECNTLQTAFRVLKNPENAV